MSKTMKRIKGKKHPKGATGSYGSYYYPEDLTLVRDEGHYLYDPRVNLPFSENTVLTIIEFGVRKNILAARLEDPEGDPDSCLIAVIDGRQSVINALEANRRLVEAGKERIKVPVEISSETPVNASRLIVILNEHRKNDDVISRGLKAKRSLESGVPMTQVMVDFNVTSAASVRNWVRLQDLIPEIQEMVRAGTITMRKALAICSLPRSKQMAEARKKTSIRSKKGGNKGVDKRRVQKLFELGGHTGNPIAERVIKWIVGDAKDSDVSDLFDLSVLKKAKKKKAKKKAATKKKATTKKKASGKKKAPASKKKATSKKKSTKKKASPTKKKASRTAPPKVVIKVPKEKKED